MTIDPKNPPLGIHRDVPSALYHKCSGASASRLRTLARSPAHCFEEMTHPSEPTPAMILGSAAHVCILQPELFGASYIVAGQCATGKQNGQRCESNGKKMVGGEWFCGQHCRSAGDAIPQTIILTEDYDTCRRMAESARKKKAASELLDARPDVEVSFFWRHLEAGVVCKGRADILPGGGIVGDLKTTEDASPEAFKYSIDKFGYYVQGAHYLDGLSTLRHRAEQFQIIAVEKSPPFEVAVYRLAQEDLQRGFDQLQRLLKVWKRCIEENRWPGYSEDVQDIQMTEYARKRMDFATDNQTRGE
jgi:PDDEXK-like domain of unknown function (DUF3799)